MRRFSMPLRVLLFACLLGIALPATVAPAGAVPDQAVVTAKPHPQPSRAERADAALDRVTDLLDGLLPPAQPQSRGDLTLALRDLALLKDALSPADRAQAEQILARPTDSRHQCHDVRCYRAPAKSKCSDVICVHWVSERQDPTNGVKGPKYVGHVLKTMTHIYDKYVAAGYRHPMADGRRGGNGKPDVYLAQIGDVGYYGYCVPEGPKRVEHGSMWGYCVLDNNYSHREFPAHTPLQNMKVTAAHEFFHDVQFAYDAGEDGWFMEATATWAEDIVYDKINDNAFYLPYGPMAHPTDTSLDTAGSLFQYGDWIFFRYLTDRYGAKTAGMPELVRKMWRGAGGKDRADYSLRSVKAALESEGTTLKSELARFSAGNRRPSTTYAGEVKELKKQGGPKYPVAPLADSRHLGPGDTVTEAKSYRHLSARTFRFKPAADAAPGSTLTLNLTLGTGAQGGAAVVVVKQTGSAPTSTLVTASGVQPAIQFEDGTTAWVEVTVVNASSRFTCWQGTRYSCAGVARDDGLSQTVNAIVS